jgi:hypothetical protein
MPVIRFLTAVVLVTSTASCSILAPIFGFGTGTEDATVYQSAMADFSLCETAVTAAERTAAAARLSSAAQSMTAINQPTNPDHFYEMDRVVAANTRCQEALSGL